MKKEMYGILFGTYRLNLFVDIVVAIAPSVCQLISGLKNKYISVSRYIVLFYIVFNLCISHFVSEITELTVLSWWESTFQNGEANNLISSLTH